VREMNVFIYGKGSLSGTRIYNQFLASEGFSFIFRIDEIKLICQISYN